MDNFKTPLHFHQLKEKYYQKGLNRYCILDHENSETYYFAAKDILMNSPFYWRVSKFNSSYYRIEYAPLSANNLDSTSKSVLMSNFFMVESSFEYWLREIRSFRKYVLNEDIAVESHFNYFTEKLYEKITSSPIAPFNLDSITMIEKLLKEVNNLLLVEGNSNKYSASIASLSDEIMLNVTVNSELITLTLISKLLSNLLCYSYSSFANLKPILTQFPIIGDVLSELLVEKKLG